MMDMDETSNQPNYLLMANEISAKLLSGELMLSENKQGKSKVWDIFAIIVDGDGQEYPDFVSCRNCHKIFRYKNKTTSNLVKHKCYHIYKAAAASEVDEATKKVEVDESTKRGITKVLTKWLIENCRPFNIVKDSGLQAVLQEFLSIGAKYGANVDIGKAMPHQTTISGNVSELYERLFERVKNEIALIKESGFGLTTDIWTDNYLKKHCVAVTIHFLKNGALTYRLLGFKSMEGKKCTSENIYKKAQELLMDFDCDFSCKSIIVHDGSTNMTKAFQNSQHLACISHLLNSTLQNSVAEVSEVSELSNMCAKLVKYFKTPGLNASLCAALKSYCPTRGNTVFYMLNSIEENWEEINHFLHSKNELHRIESINLDYLKAVTETLRPFEEAITTLEGENNSTLHLVLIYLHQLKKSCESNYCDLDVIRRLKEKLLFYLDTTVNKNITMFHKLALFLYPPTNKLLLFSNSEKQFIEDECVRHLKSFQNETPTEREELKATTSPVSKKAKLFLDFVEPESNSNERVINQELQLYKNTRVINSADFNVFSWWERQQKVFPLLYKLSCIVLATPASSASLERIFSVAGNIISQKRYSLSLKDTGVNQIMFIHSNVGHDEQVDNDESKQLTWK